MSRRHAKAKGPGEGEIPRARQLAALAVPVLFLLSAMAPLSTVPTASASDPASSRAGEQLTGRVLDSSTIVVKNVGSSTAIVDAVAKRRAGGGLDYEDLDPDVTLIPNESREIGGLDLVGARGVAVLSKRGYLYPINMPAESVGAVITGSTQPGAPVTAVVRSKPSIYTTRADSEGRFEFIVPASKLEGGGHHFRIIAGDARDVGEFNDDDDHGWKGFKEKATGRRSIGNGDSIDVGKMDLEFEPFKVIKSEGENPKPKLVSKPKISAKRKGGKYVFRKIKVWRFQRWRSGGLARFRIKKVHGYDGDISVDDVSAGSPGLTVAAKRWTDGGTYEVEVEPTERAEETEHVGVTLRATSDFGDEYTRSSEMDLKVDEGAHSRFLKSWKTWFELEAKGKIARKGKWHVHSSTDAGVYKVFKGWGEKTFPYKKYREAAELASEMESGRWKGVERHSDVEVVKDEKNIAFQTKEGAKVYLRNQKPLVDAIVSSLVSWIPGIEEDLGGTIEPAPGWDIKATWWEPVTKRYEEESDIPSDRTCGMYGCYDPTPDKKNIKVLKEIPEYRYLVSYFKHGSGTFRRKRSAEKAATRGDRQKVSVKPIEWKARWWEKGWHSKVFGSESKAKNAANGHGRYDGKIYTKYKAKWYTSDHHSQIFNTREEAETATAAGYNRKITPIPHEKWFDTKYTGIWPFSHIHHHGKVVDTKCVKSKCTDRDYKIKWRSGWDYRWFNSKGGAERWGSVVDKKCTNYKRKCVRYGRRRKCRWHRRCYRYKRCRRRCWWLYCWKSCSWHRRCYRYKRCHWKRVCTRRKRVCTNHKYKARRAVYRSKWFDTKYTGIWPFSHIHHHGKVVDTKCVKSKCLDRDYKIEWFTYKAEWDTRNYGSTETYLKSYADYVATKGDRHKVYVKPIEWKALWYEKDWKSKKFGNRSAAEDCIDKSGRYGGSTYATKYEAKWKRKVIEKYDVEAFADIRAAILKALYDDVTQSKEQVDTDYKVRYDQRHEKTFEGHLKQLNKYGEWYDFTPSTPDKKRAVKSALASEEAQKLAAEKGAKLELVRDPGETWYLVTTEGAKKIRVTYPKSDLKRKIIRSFRYKRPTFDVRYDVIGKTTDPSEPFRGRVAVSGDGNRHFDVADLSGMLRFTPKHDWMDGRYTARIIGRDTSPPAGVSGLTDGESVTLDVNKPDRPPEVIWVDADEKGFEIVAQDATLVAHAKWGGYEGKTTTTVKIVGFGGFDSPVTLSAKGASYTDPRDESGLSSWKLGAKLDSNTLSPGESTTVRITFGIAFNPSKPPADHITIVGRSNGIRRTVSVPVHIKGKFKP